jgi:hypothetical protein
MGTGKIMNQSRKLFTPVLAGCASETTLMPLFHEMIATFKEIEERGYCEVDGIQHEAPIKGGGCCRHVVRVEMCRARMCEWK